MRPLFVVPALVLAAALGGCASPTPVASAPDPSPSSTSPESTTEEDDFAACAIVADTLQPSVDIVTNIVNDGTGQSLDPGEVSNVADQLREMLELSTARMDAYAAPYASIVLLLDDIFEGRADGSTTMDTGAYRDASIEILNYCVEDVGYTK